MAYKEKTRKMIRCTLSPYLTLEQEFFIRRFHKLPENDRLYFEEWVMRLKGGNPERHMDSESLEVYKKILKERKERID